MTSDLKRSVSLGLGTLVILALIGVAALTKDLSRRLADVATAATDNVQWVISQVEVEYLMFHGALMDAETGGAAALPELRTRFDVLFSRIGTVSQSSVFESLRGNSDFDTALREIRRFLAETVDAIDGTDGDLLAQLPKIKVESDALHDAVRSLGLTGVTHFAVAGDSRRAGVEAALARVVALSSGLIAILLVVSGLLLFLVSRLRRSSEAAESARARASAVVASSLDAVIVANIKGQIVEYNSAAEQIFGFAAEEVIGRKLSETIVPPHLRAAHDAGLERYLDTETPKVIGAGRVQLEGLRKDGALFPVELSIASASTDDEEVFVSFLRDITDRLEGEAELREARDRALAGERAKAHFIAVMSHEMRTPLNGILGTLQLIDDAKLTPKTKHYLDVIRQSGDLLLQHVNDVLEISKVDAGRATVDVSAFDLRQVIDDVVAGQMALARAAGTTISVALGPDLSEPVLGDARRLRQVMLNLVGNAVKFTTGGEVTILAERLGAGDYIELQIMDTGIGIPEDERDSVFEDFVTLDASYGRENNGTGLGLAITRRTVELLGGTIGVESELGEGSVFWVRLPLPRSDDATARAPQGHRGPDESGAAVSADPGTVLIAEDNDINRLIVEEMLKDAGYTLLTARDGAEALAIAQSTPLDAILMDISMPQMDGLEATRAIRARGLNRKTPIIAVTAHALPDEVRRFQEAGMDAVMTKPVTRMALLAALSAPRDAAQPTIPEDAADHDALDRLQSEIGPARAAGLISAFVAQADHAIAHFSAAHPAETADADLIAEIHRLAGACAAFGASRLHAELCRLEDRGKSGKIDEVWADVKKLGALWAGCRPVYLHRKGDHGPNTCARLQDPKG